MDNMLAPPERMCRIETGTEHTLLDDRDVLLCEDHLQFPNPLISPSIHDYLHIVSLAEHTLPVLLGLAGRSRVVVTVRNRRNFAREGLAALSECCCPLVAR